MPRDLSRGEDIKANSCALDRLSALVEGEPEKAPNLYKRRITDSQPRSEVSTSAATLADPTGHWARGR